MIMNMHEGNGDSNGATSGPGSELLARSVNDGQNESHIEMTTAATDRGNCIKHKPTKVP